jgi:hypothetical protein
VLSQLFKVHCTVNNVWCNQCNELQGKQARKPPLVQSDVTLQGYE